MVQTFWVVMGKDSEIQWLLYWVAQEGRALQDNVGHVGVAFWNRMNQKGLWEESFAVLSGSGSPWFLSQMWLGSLNNSAGSQGNTIQEEYAGMHLVHLIRRVWRGHYLVEQSKERNLRLGHLRSSQLYQISTQQLRPHPNTGHSL